MMIKIQLQKREGDRERERERKWWGETGVLKKAAMALADRQTLTLVAVAVGPADGPGALAEEAPGVDLAVGVAAVAVVAQAPARVLQHIVGKLGPLQAV